MRRIYAKTTDTGRKQEVFVHPGCRRVTVMLAGSDFPHLHWSWFPRLAALRIGLRLRREGYRRVA